VSSHIRNPTSFFILKLRNTDEAPLLSPASKPLIISYNPLGRGKLDNGEERGQPGTFVGTEQRTFAVLPPQSQEIDKVT